MGPERISVQDAKRKYDSNPTTVLIDVRSPEAWGKAKTKIAGALRVPPDEVKRYLSDIPRGQSIITYCT